MAKKEKMNVFQFMDAMSFVYGEATVLLCVDFVFCYFVFICCKGFLVEYLGVFMYRIISLASEHALTFPFLLCTSFYPSFLTSLAKTDGGIMGRSGRELNVIKMCCIKSLTN